MLKKLNDLTLKLYFVLLGYGGPIGAALAQTSSDPSAPLDILKTARDKAKNSNLTADSAAAGGSRAGFTIMIICGVIGIGLASNSGIKLYKAQQDPNSREESGRSFAGVVIGSGITIIGILIGVVTNYMTGSN